MKQIWFTYPRTIIKMTTNKWESLTILSAISFVVSNVIWNYFLIFSYTKIINELKVNKPLKFILAIMFGVIFSLMFFNYNNLITLFSSIFSFKILLSILPFFFNKFIKKVWHSSHKVVMRRSVVKNKNKKYLSFYGLLS